MAVVVLGLQSCAAESKPKTAASKGSIARKEFVEGSSAPDVAFAVPCESMEMISPRQQHIVHQPADEVPSSARDPVITVTGRIEKMGWAKSAESWNAGGSDYYVLVRDAESQSSSYSQRVILRTTPKYPLLADFHQFAGRTVIVRGRSAKEVKVEVHPESQYPVFEVFEEKGADGTVRLYRWFGGGLMVDSITVSDPVKTPEHK